MIIEVKEWNIINKDEYFEFMRNLQDGYYEIKKYIKNRSNEQNRYYRWLLSIVEKDSGIPVEEVHEKMRMKFLYVPESWTQLWYCKSTAKLTSFEFSEYIENIKNFMAQYWIILPDANDFNSINK